MSTRSFSQELLLNSEDGGPWRWSAGVFYRDAHDRLGQGFPTPPTVYYDDSESAALFGEIGQRFGGGRWEWTAGARYFHDEVVSRDEAGYYAEETFDAVTPRLVLSYYPSSGLTIYGSYSEGFRSGFPQNANIALGRPDFLPVEPDRIHNYEVGARGGAFDGHMTFDAAIYFIDWQDVQQTLSVPDPFTNICCVTAPVNGAAANGIGAEVGATLRPIDGLMLSANVSWNDLSLTEEILAGDLQVFAAGDRLNYSPEYTANASAEYSWALSRALTAEFALSASYSSEQVNHIVQGNPPTLIVLARGDDFLSVRSRFSISSSGGWTASLFGDNLTNEDGSMPGISPVPDWTQRVRPRTIGVQIDYRFK
jgi:outer membrane receptor protein involved in Fe transport